MAANARGADGTVADGALTGAVTSAVTGAMTGAEIALRGAAWIDQNAPFHREHAERVPQRRLTSWVADLLSTAEAAALLADMGDCDVCQARVRSLRADFDTWSRSRGRGQRGAAAPDQGPPVSSAKPAQ